MLEFSLLLYALAIWMRVILVALLLVAVLLATLAWAERTRRLNPFGAAARMARRLDPLITPVERRIGRFGGTHANAPWWGVLVVLLIGAAAIGLVGYVQQMLFSIHMALEGGARGVLKLVVSSTFMVLQIALIGRVIMSWIGGTYSRLGQLAYSLTEWFLGPLRSALPTLGMVDISPMVAYFALSLIRGFVLGAL